MLPQKPAPRGRKLKLRQFVVWSVLPFLGVVTAFGVMPQTGTGSAGTQTVVEEITLPHTAPSGNATTFWRNDRVQGGDTVADLLRRLNVEDSAADNYLRTARAVESFRKLSAGKAVQAETASDGSLLALRYPDNSGDHVLIEKNGNSFSARTLPAQLEHRIFMRTGEIKTTLFAATDEANLPEPAANQLANIFGSYIDFHHELRSGDRFSVIYEVSYSNGEPVRAGRILAAEFINRGKLYRALYFQNGDSGDYYTPEGYSMHLAFLRSPVEFSRISSGFTSSRLYPIMHKWRAHKGVDFAAPMGTKVMVTAEGTVSFVGEQTGYGNLVIVKHEGRFSTAYGHLSRFASQLHAGQRVVQGEVIGYVGKTGWATGPHLHYEFRVDGQQRNPLRVSTPVAPSISNTQRNAFLDATRDLSTRLGILHNISLAQID
ncbi:MAG TPA: peptidoglycan DD-metalloendopeptidase family protein [Gallionellaceae bacterium]|nr:peptidoglycan DD-metalloendopeptidase family protein [Gallionellaceae bacterium]